MTTESQDLPEGCIAHILSYTSTPVDAARLSLVSKTFRSAAESDHLWDRFIPSDLSSIISPSSIPSSNSKKDLYFTLSDRPTIIDQDKKSFQLDKRSGNKCYMLSARALHITWGQTSQYWQWISLPDLESRFQEVAKLYAVCWFDFTGEINTRVLSPNTHYATFLVFKMIDASGFHHDPVVLSVGVLGGSNSSKYVCLDPNLEDDELDDKFRGLPRPTLRKDEWLEIEMGEFFNSGQEEDQVHMKVQETTSNMWKHGFVLEGIEVRPKHVSSVNNCG